MGKLLVISVGLLSVVSAWVVYGIFSDGDAPQLPEFYWGPKEKQNQKEDTSIRPFKINIEEKVLADLKTRLTLELSPEGNRLTPPLEGIGFQYGFNTNFLKTVTNHWLNKYDWRAREKTLNKYPHFKTNINGIDIHFQHVKSLSKKYYKHTKPLLLLHGWPGSFVEFQKIIPLLTDPVNSELNFELVIPSLPGYGFSERAHRPGLGHVEAAQIFLNLMKRLGHEQFYVQGGDWGALIGSNMAALYPKNVVAYHSNMCVGMHPRGHIRVFLAALYPSLFMHQDDIPKIFPLSKYYSTLIEESGYMHLQSTKPDTVGVALSNSPSGLAAYILEKFSTWTKGDWKTKENGGLIPYYQLDDLLDNLMIYWITNSFTSSARFYSEAFTHKELAWGMDKVPVRVPTGCFATTEEFGAQSEFQILDKFPNVLSYTRASKGGHFAAFEVPDALATDVVKFFNLVLQNEEKESTKSTKKQ